MIKNYNINIIKILFSKFDLFNLLKKASKKIFKKILKPENGNECKDDEAGELLN